MDPAAAENRRIRHTLRDLIAISALPVLWVGYDPRQLAESLIYTGWGDVLDTI